MGEGHGEALQRIANTVATTRGETSFGLRQAVASRTASIGGSATPPTGDLPEELRALVEKIGRHAYKVTPEDIEALKAKGHSEDWIFEVVVSAAVGAGLGRYERGLKALRGEI